MKITKDKVIFTIIISIIVIVLSTITTYASNYLFNSNEVSYNNTSSGITSDNVQGAIDELYEEATNYAQIREMIYPVGSIYFSATDDTVAKVEARYGGTWEVFGAGRTIIGVGTGTDANSTSKTFVINETNGEYTHKLTIAEMPNHSHAAASNTYFATKISSGGVEAYGTGTSSGYKMRSLSTTASAGGDGAHNNLQPYITVYMYKRTA